MEDEKKYEVDDSESTSQDGGSSSHEHSADDGKTKPKKATASDKLAASLATMTQSNTQIQTQPD